MFIVDNDDALATFFVPKFAPANTDVVTKASDNAILEIHLKCFLIIFSFLSLPGIFAADIYVQPHCYDFMP